MDKLEHIENRRQKLIRLNGINNYSTTLVSKEKSVQYYRLLTELKSQKASVYNERRQNKNYNNNLKKAVSNISKVLSSPVKPKTLIPIR